MLPEFVIFFSNYFVDGLVSTSLSLTFKENLSLLCVIEGINHNFTNN
jgi:hypothetical protein